MNYYNILNLPLYSDIKDIKNQYLNLLKSTKDETKIKELNKIYTFLKDPLNKFNYDNQLKEELNKSQKSNLDDFYDNLDNNKITDKDIEKILYERSKQINNRDINVKLLYSEEEVKNIIENDKEFKQISNINDDNDFKPISTDEINFEHEDINNDLYKNVDELYKKSKQDKNIDEYIKARDEELKVINSLNKK